MNHVYVTGHRNPDLDSVASAYVYAHLKCRIDLDTEYLAVRCGNLNEQTRTVFSKLGITPPQYLKDVKTVVADVVNTDVPRLEICDPLQTAIGLLDETGASILPVFDTDGVYKGIVSSIEVSHFLMRETFGARPTYRLRIDNLSKVVPGRILRLGNAEEFTAPIMIGAMPFERSVERISALESNRPLLIVGLRRDLVDYAISHNFPAVVLTGATDDEAAELDFERYSGSVYLSDVDTAETIRLLRFSTPLNGILNSDVPRLNSQDDFDVAKKTLASSGLRGLPVFDDKQFVGVVSRASFLDRPKNRLILVDHNEVGQSINGAGEAQIVEIVDHHRVGAVMSREPFVLFTKPVGCTCTILRQLYRQYGVAVSTEIALLMLSAILSDTIMLKSPTTTEEDKQTVEGLARHAGVDWHQWAQEIFTDGSQLADQDPKEIVAGDFKSYSAEGVRFGISQVEVQTLSDLREAAASVQEALADQARSESLEGSMLLITDVMSGNSVLLFHGLDDVIKALPYEVLDQGILNLPGILSRKKQLLPEVLRTLEEIRQAN